jgi:hypothetical protein
MSGHTNRHDVPHMHSVCITHFVQRTHEHVRGNTRVCVVTGRVPRMSPEKKKVKEK